MELPKKVAGNKWPWAWSISQMHSHLPLFWPHQVLKYGPNTSKWQVTVTMKSEKCNFYLSDLCSMSCHISWDMGWISREVVHYTHCYSQLESLNMHRYQFSWFYFSVTVTTHSPNIKQLVVCIISSKGVTPSPFLTAFGIWWYSIFLYSDPSYFPENQILKCTFYWQWHTLYNLAKERMMERRKVG
jgi:hypothetical protein